MRRRVLLYEPMQHGHRGVLLGYYRRALQAAQYETVEYTTMLPGHNSPALIDELEALAERASCDVIHVLTFESLGPKWLRYPRLRRRSGRPIVATYYLYENLYKPLPGLVWDALFLRGLVSRVLISDDLLLERRIPDWRRARLSFVPDPWDPADFPAIDRARAKLELGLPLDRPVFLLFGALKPRKGVDLLLAAAERLSAADDLPCMVVLAGQLAPEFRSGEAGAAIARLRARGYLRIDDRFIDEASVSAYFHGADFVVCPYPRSFAVSSNVFTRACAAGTPAIVSNHGVVGEVARRARAGLLFRADSVEDLARCMKEACAPEGRARLRCVTEHAQALAAGRTLEQFSLAVAVAYRKLCLS